MSYNHHMNEHQTVLDLRHRVSELEQELKNKSDFLSMIVHQLRTPLSATKWIFKMMMDGDLGAVSEEQRNIIRRGYDSNEQVIRMLAEVSEANHVSEWKLNFRLAPTNITECIEGAIGEFSGEAKSKGVTLAFQKGEVPYVSADREKICLVVQNLLENAIKYNRKDGTVTVRTETFRDRLVVSVTDTGIGIPMDSQKDIFKKFYRAQNARDAEKGTGLGLYVGKQIMDGHHGDIWFESSPGFGTTFFFSLPLAVPQAR